MSVAAAKRPANPEDRSSFHTKAVKHPLLDYHLVEDSAQATYVTSFRPDKHWVLDEHRILGKATLVGTAYLEMAGAAFENYTQSSHFEMQEIYLLHPLTVEENEQKEVHTLLKRQGDAYEFSIRSRSNSKVGEWQEHTRGTIATLSEPSAEGKASPTHYDLQKIKARCRQPEIIRTPAEQAEVYFIKFGPRWNITGHIYWGENEGLACLELPEAFVADLQSYLLHPALLDMATGFLLAQAEGAYLPFSYKRLCRKAPLPRKLYSYSRYSENSRPNQEILQFDIVLLDEQGNILVEIDEYTVRRVTVDPEKQVGGMPAPATGRANPAYSTSAPGLPLNASGDQIQSHLLKYGLSSAEGIAVFNRILAATDAQVLVSTRDLLARQREFASSYLISLLEQNNPARQTYQRPELSKPYVAPRNETEQILVSIYQDLLGIGQIGIEDDFWELGGHSLLATQVIARLRQAFGLALPLQALFEEPTVAGLAAYIETMQQVVHSGQAEPHTDIDELEEGAL
ncbi:MAG: polyketide synthase dehydratase domain-containing protein [Candidatus Competibacteraceae bacterium]